jgi:hypothetical protein
MLKICDGVCTGRRARIFPQAARLGYLYLFLPCEKWLISRSFGPWPGPPFYTSKGIPQWPNGMTAKCQAALCGGYARWCYEPCCPPCRLARRTDGTRPAGLVSLHVSGTHNDVFYLPTAVGFLCVLSMHVPGAGHKSFVAGGACHTLIPDDSGVAPCTPLTVPSLGKESSLASFLLPSREGYLSATLPSRQGRGLEQRPTMPC